MNVILFIRKILITVYEKTNNNYKHVCYRERTFVIKKFHVICQIYLVVTQCEKLAEDLTALSIMKKTYYQFI